MSHSRTRRYAHVPPWKLRTGYRPGVKPDCTHRGGWETVEIAGRPVDICRRCGTERKVQA